MKTYRSIIKAQEQTLYRMTMHYQALQALELDNCREKKKEKKKKSPVALCCIYYTGITNSSANWPVDQHMPALFYAVNN
jgi:hypothetical protein